MVAHSVTFQVADDQHAGEIPGGLLFVLEPKNAIKVELSVPDLEPDGSICFVHTSFLTGHQEDKNALPEKVEWRLS